MRMASFTTLTATMLLSDSDPLSFVTKALLTEKPLSGAALPWESQCCLSNKA